jgi:hypothetical protein
MMALQGKGLSLPSYCRQAKKEVRRRYITIGASNICAPGCSNTTDAMGLLHRKQ